MMTAEIAIVKPADETRVSFRDLVAYHLDSMEDEQDAWYASPEGMAQLERQAEESRWLDCYEDGNPPF